MNKEHLLQSFSNIDDTLLAECDKPNSQHHNHLSFRYAFIFTVGLTLLLSTILLVFTGCAYESPDFKLDSTNGTTCANITMSRGAFAYRDGFIYMVGSSGICEYEIETEKTTVISVPTGYVSSSIIVTADHVGYNDNGLVAVTKDGKTAQRIFEDETCGELYIDGSTAYYRAGLNQALCVRDLSKKDGAKQTILENVNSYHVSDQNIYAVCLDGEKYKAIYSPKESIAFQEILLSFEPKSILSDNDDLYITEYVPQQKSMQVIKVSNGEETRLPVYAYVYQVLDGIVIYLDEKTPGNGFKRVKSYDPETGREAVLCEDVSDFAILDNRYITFEQHEHIGSTHWSYLDWETGEMHEKFYTDWDNK